MAPNSENKLDFSLYTFLRSCLNITDLEFQRGVLKVLLCLLMNENDPKSKESGDKSQGKTKKTDEKKKLKSICKSKLQIVKFCYNLILTMAGANELRPESQHDLMVLSLIMFSQIVPPSSLNQELKM